MRWTRVKWLRVGRENTDTHRWSLVIFLRTDLLNSCLNWVSSLELGQVVCAGDWQDTLDHTVVLFDCHPAVTDEEEPVDITRDINHVFTFCF